MPFQVSYSCLLHHPYPRRSAFLIASVSAPHVGLKWPRLKPFVAFDCVADFTLEVLVLLVAAVAGQYNHQYPPTAPSLHFSSLLPKEYDPIIVMAWFEPILAVLRRSTPRKLHSRAKVMDHLPSWWKLLELRGWTTLWPVLWSWMLLRSGYTGLPQGSPAEQGFFNILTCLFWKIAENSWGCYYVKIWTRNFQSDLLCITSRAVSAPAGVTRITCRAWFFQHSATDNQLELLDKCNKRKQITMPPKQHHIY